MCKMGLSFEPIMARHLVEICNYRSMNAKQKEWLSVLEKLIKKELL